LSWGDRVAGGCGGWIRAEARGREVEGFGWGSLAVGRRGGFWGLGVRAAGERKLCGCRLKAPRTRHPRAEATDSREREDFRDWARLPRGSGGAGVGSGWFISLITPSPWLPRRSPFAGLPRRRLGTLLTQADSPSLGARPLRHLSSKVRSQALNRFPDCAAGPSTPQPPLEATGAGSGTLVAIECRNGGCDPPPPGRGEASVRNGSLVLE
jgi:hypothetical protein